MARLQEPKSSLLTIKYQPDGDAITENPPRFIWMPESEEDLDYKLQISSESEFEEGTTKTFRNIPYNFYTLDYTLEAGTYFWRYTLEEGDFDYSKARTFIVKEGIPETPMTNRKNRYEDIPSSHPRIWLNKAGIEDFRKQLKKDKNYCGFQDFHEQSIAKYKNQEFTKEPLPYPENKRVVSLWRESYSNCQQALCYIRSLAVGGVLLQEADLIEKAKKALLEMAGWDLNGSTNRDYNDESAFRVAYALAFGYDWLYDYLSENERKEIIEKIYIRTKQVADHIILHSRIHFSLYDSHAVRSLSSVLTPCCIAMLGENKDAKKWLDYTLEYFNVIYTPWGGKDGGWAEGALYWTTGMAFVIEALNTIKIFMGVDLYRRPFFQKAGDFPLYCNPTDTYRASFGDQSNLGKYPGHKTAFNMRQFAGVTGNGNYNRYFEQVFQREPEIDPDFFNSGWWDFAFDDMVYQHDYKDVKLSEAAPPDKVKWFQDIDWVAIHLNYEDPENRIFFLTKSSPYGSVSHSHGDQNDFVLFAYGEPLAIKSGHYVGFNTSMHKEWRRQTKSSNTLLIDSKGQYAGMDKMLQLSAKGKICEVKEEVNKIYIRENATESYKCNVPYLKDYTREIYCIDDAYFVIADTVELEEAAEISWLLHSLNSFEISGDKFCSQGEMAGLEGRFVYCSSGILEITNSDEFEGVDPKEMEGLENQWHLSMKTHAKKNHRIVTLLVPYKKGSPKTVTPIKDDQGHDVYIYFSHEGNTFSLRNDGSKRY